MIGVPVEIEDMLKKAWEAVEKADVPEHVQPYAFKEAMRVIAPDSASSRRSPAGFGAHTSSGTSEDAGGAAITEAEMLDKIVVATGVDSAALEQLIHLDDDGPRISIPGTKVAKNNADATRTVASILTVVRDFGLGEKETPVKVIRNEVDRLRVYDPANFSKHLESLPGFQVVGTGQGRRIRSKTAGIKEFPELVDRLVNGTA